MKLRSALLLSLALATPTWAEDPAPADKPAPAPQAAPAPEAAPAAAPTPEAAPAAPAEAEHPAAALWRAECKVCHGEDGRAQTKVGRKEGIPDMSRPKWQEHESDNELRRVISNGSRRNRKMKAYKGKLSPEQIDSLVAYIRTLKKA